MFYFRRGATAVLVPGFLCQSGRRRPENVSILSSQIRELKQRRRRRQRERQKKETGFYWPGKTKALHVRHALLYIS